MKGVFAQLYLLGALGKNLHEALKGYCSYVTKGHLGEGKVVLRDDNGNDHLFLFETFHNSHDALTLGLYACPAPIVVNDAFPQSGITHCLRSVL